jgi:Zn-dependent protease
MAFGDRDYYRERPMGSNPLMWLLNGTVPLFTFMGINVKAHSTLVIYIVVMLVFGIGGIASWQDRVIGAAALFMIVLLHEFGHCFTARWVGGRADEIIMHPLGGLAMTDPPRRPWPVFLTVAGGPAVNVLICIIAAIVCAVTIGYIPWIPFFLHNAALTNPDFVNEIGRIAFWIFSMSWALFLLNLMPIYPLDGGQMLQTMLWPKFGYHRATYFSATVGMVGGAVAVVLGLASLTFFLAALGLMGIFYCYQKRQQLLADWPDPWAESLEEDYSASFARQKKEIDKNAKKLAQLEEADRKEREEVDKILAKVKLTGMNSLTRKERRTLDLASEHMQQRDAEIRQRRKGSLGL